MSVYSRLPATFVRRGSNWQQDSNNHCRFRSMQYLTILVVNVQRHDMKMLFLLFRVGQ